MAFLRAAVAVALILSRGREEGNRRKVSRDEAGRPRNRAGKRASSRRPTMHVGIPIMVNSGTHRPPRSDAINHSVYCGIFSVSPSFTDDRCA
jgi:hypothetical protein